MCKTDKPYSQRGNQLKNTNKKVRDEDNLEQISGTVIAYNTREARVRALAIMTRAARDDALGLNLKFEAYLLDMAFIALSEHLEK